MINIFVTKTLSTLLSIQKYFLQKINKLFCIITKSKKNDFQMKR